MLTRDRQRGRGPLLPANTCVLPSIRQNQLTDLQLTLGSVLPQAHSVPGSEGLRPLPPLHGGRLAQLTVQGDCGPFCGLLASQPPYELSW